jgi:hypothetical protein
MLTNEEKIAWLEDHIHHLRIRIVAEEDSVHTMFLKKQLKMFQSLLEDMYAIRLWNKANNTEIFDWHIVPINLN